MMFPEVREKAFQGAHFRQTAHKKRGLFFVAALCMSAFFSAAFSGVVVFADSNTADVTITVAMNQSETTIDTTQAGSATVAGCSAGAQLGISTPANVLSSGDEVKATLSSLTEDTATNGRTLPTDTTAVGCFYDISFAKTSDGSAVTSFDQLITLTVTYLDSEIDSSLGESTFKIYQWNGSAWTALSSTVTTSANTVSASTASFSNTLFGVLGTVPEPEPSPTPAPTPSGGGGGGGGGGIILSQETKVVFEGLAFPSNSVTLLKDAQVAATTVTGGDARFSLSLSNITAGNYIFSVYGEDKDGYRSSLQTFPLSVTAGATTKVSGIFIAPTISTDKAEVRRGDTVTIFGQTAPSADVLIEVNSEEPLFAKVPASAVGVYLYNFDTSALLYGSHSAKSKASRDGQITGFSSLINFKVGDRNVDRTLPTRVLKGDINGDGRVNLIDFSIAAFWYKRILSAEFAQKEIERLNGDGQVNLVDFSIMAFYWTG